MTEAPTTSAFPEVRGHWLMGMAGPMSKAPHMLPARLGLDNGGVARFRILHYPVLAITDPAVTREVLHSDKFVRTYHYETYSTALGQSLLATDGPHWSRRRRMVLPAFKTGHLNRFTRIMRDCTLEVLDSWAAQAQSGQPMNTMDMAMYITMSVISMSLVSVRVQQDDANRLASYVDRILTNMRVRNNAFPRFPLWAPTPIHRELRRMGRELDAYLGPFVRERLAKTENERIDLLDDMRAARAAGTGEAMNFTELLEETKTLYTTGYETSSITVAWMLYLLAASPDKAEPWHEEVNRVLPGDTIPDRLRLEDFPYTTAIVNETMRLYPAVYNVVRKAREDTTLNGQPVRKGETALMSIFGLQRNPAYWDAPDTFDPQRFIKDPNNPAFLPFASGGHLCIGSHFAMLEMVTIMVLVGRRFRLRAAAPMPGMLPRVTLVPEQPLLVTLEPYKAA